MPEGRCGQCTSEDVCVLPLDCCSRAVNDLTEVRRSSGKTVLRSHWRVEMLPANSLQVRRQILSVSDVLVDMRKICFCIILAVEKKDSRHKNATFFQLFTPETRKVFNPFSNPAINRDLEISRSNLRSWLTSLTLQEFSGFGEAPQATAAVVICSFLLYFLWCLL